MVASSAILGETIATAVGSAWAFAMDGAPRVAVTFFGDGVCEEGIFHETLNFAAVKNVPVIFVCANNGLSTNTPLSVRQPAGHEIWKWAAGYGMPSVRVDGNDVFAVHDAAVKAVAHAKSGKGPSFIEGTTFRARVHVGYETDDMKGYRFRAREDVEAGMKLDPINRATAALLANGSCSQADIDEMYAAARRAMDEAVAVAKASPFPSVDELLVGTY
jgi:pyruvate dehydrogenase E1 component alpha subunit